jgi:hypothetical protein
MRITFTCVIRTTPARRTLADTVIRLLESYQDRVPPFEIILALDAGNDNWTPYRYTTTAPRQGREAVWQQLHRKYLGAFVAARGEWIVCVDDDDWFSPERLRYLPVAEADVVYTNRVYVHELRSIRRRTYRRVMHPPGLLESTVAFRRELLDRRPLVEPELGLWVQKLKRDGARVEERFWDHVMFLHGDNADLAAGRDGLRVSSDDTVLDGPAEYTCVGNRGAVLDVMGEDALQAWERAAPPWAGCDVKPFSSRACERGTRGCEVRHR